MKPKLCKSTTKAKTLGKVVIGSSASDIHDNGLNIANFLVDANCFKTFRLGIDVTKEKFITKIKGTSAHVFGLNRFLNPTFDEMKQTVEAL